MFHQPRSLKRTLALGLAACMIAPAAASAAPIIDGQGVAAGGGPGVTAKQFESQNLTAPDQVDRVGAQAKANVYVPPAPAQVASTNPAPTWPSGPQPAATRHAPVTAAPAKATPSDDGGLDTGVWVALSGAALVAAGGIALAGRLRVTRKRQLA